MPQAFPHARLDDAGLEHLGTALVQPQVPRLLRRVRLHFQPFFEQQRFRPRGAIGERGGEWRVTVAAGFHQPRRQQG
jgi:hypothetical protein